jgi:MtN3 and saliva related transmembrane protein
MILFVRPSDSVLNAIGSVAAFCTTISLFPQLLRVWRRKQADDISLLMFVVFSFGIAGWLTYGLCILSLPMILGNGLTLVQAVAILFLKQKYAGAHVTRGLPR